MYERMVGQPLNNRNRCDQGESLFLCKIPLLLSEICGDRGAEIKNAVTGDSISASALVR